ncbi:Crp/Fnr family transcriptional regulator [Dysgonomonas sp. Marseille-P4677]|uniref:Crp/Fnr family transcriptional regulator n=1 Tax=Dysgonomonas sp. Marseille-P4677 TaxID=2364790 RepID=UPI0019134DF0|nr:Crp/Fnr family transcriptional regulator [Dysgonomonas sp. Marseille-P4677]MBK5719828.1 Crp/Fnr family transcriptional regulator [Dysgonomonas sp. Marseille-P4677]
MKIVLKTYSELIKKECPFVSDGELRFFIGGLTVMKLKNKELYIKANSIQENIGFVYKGLIRCFYIKENCKDVTYSFVKEGGYITHYPAFINRQPSKYSFQCLEPSTIINISHNHIQICFEKCPSLLFYLSMSLGKEFTVQLSRIEGFLFDDAETRYLNFINENKDLYNRISLTHLSSYLGIERQSLTRIRKNLIQKKI